MPILKNWFTQTKTYKMKPVLKLLFGIAITALVIYLSDSCNNNSSKNEDNVKESETEILAVYIEKDGSKNVSFVYRKIFFPTKYDSFQKKRIIISDTIWGKPLYIPELDSLNRPILDSLKKPKYKIVYQLISKDSINWRIQNIPKDTLLKK